MTTDASSVKLVSKQLIELSSSKVPVHSFNRQLVRLIVDGLHAMAATLWLVRENELVLCEEIEQTVGAVRSLGMAQERQQVALRRAFEQSLPSVLGDATEGFDPLKPAREEQHNVVFVPVAGLQGNVGVLRLIFPPMDAAELSLRAQLAETLAGYYSLYSAQRVLSIQHEERRDIDRLSKAILQLQHYTFSLQLHEVIVNSAVEVAGLDRVSLLTADKKGRLHVACVSSVSTAQKGGVWARLLSEVGQIIMQKGEPLHFFPGHVDPEEIEDEELRERVNSYVVMTDAKSLLFYPLTSGAQKVGVIVFESFKEQILGSFERVLCTVFATHCASAIGNNALFLRMPFAKLRARNIEREREKTKRGPARVEKILKAALVLSLLAALVWFVGYHPVPEKIGAQCFVEPEIVRVVTAKIPGEVQRVNFAHGQFVRQSDVLIQFRTDDIRLNLDKEKAGVRNIQSNIDKLRGEADDARDPDQRGSLLAELGSLEHELAAKQKTVELLTLKLQDCTLRAPLTGIVLDPDQPEKLLGLVVPEGEPLCRVGNIHEKAKVRVAIEAARVLEVREGLEVEIRLRSRATEEVLEGEIDKLERHSVTYKNANVFMADVIVPNQVRKDKAGGKPQLALKIGMTGKAKIIRDGESTYFAIYGGLLKRKLSYWLY